MTEKEFTGDVMSGTRDACVPQVDMWCGPSAMVWAAILAQHRSDLVFIDGNLNAVRYRDEILGPVVLPLMERVGGHTAPA